MLIYFDPNDLRVVDFYDDGVFRPGPDHLVPIVLNGLPVFPPAAIDVDSDDADVSMQFGGGEFDLTGITLDEWIDGANAFIGLYADFIGSKIIKHYPAAEAGIQAQKRIQADAVLAGSLSADDAHLLRGEAEIRGVSVIDLAKKVVQYASVGELAGVLTAEIRVEASLALGSVSDWREIPAIYGAAKVRAEAALAGLMGE